MRGERKRDENKRKEGRGRRRTRKGAYTVTPPWYVVVDGMTCSTSSTASTGSHKGEMPNTVSVYSACRTLACIAWPKNSRKCV
jgi:hypothetical protein